MKEKQLVAAVKEMKKTVPEMACLRVTYGNRGQGLHCIILPAISEFAGVIPYFSIQRKDRTFNEMAMELLGYCSAGARWKVSVALINNGWNGDAQ